MTRDELFSQLWDNYTLQNPSVKKVYESFTKLGETVINDHIALRTFNDPRMNIDVLEKPFKDTGYVEIEKYTFKSKKLKARHYEVPNDNLAPKVFISELILEDFSDEFQNIITSKINNVENSAYQDLELIFKGNVWGVPSYKEYNQLREESEYAAWLYVFGFRANHFTVSINNLKKLNTIEKVNSHLEDNGFLLNSQGGKIKGSKSDLLQQSSTMAERIKIKFSEGTYEIPSCFYEFAIRYPNNSGKLFGGFLAKNADKIFESTNFYDKKEQLKL